MKMTVHKTSTGANFRSKTLEEERGVGLGGLHMMEHTENEAMGL